MQNKKIRVIKNLLAVAAIAGTGLFAGASESQAATASANATATVVTPISITKQADLQFGKFIAGGSGGTVVITPAGSRSATAGVTLYAPGSVQTAAAFNVTGDGSSTYAITLPADGTITLSDGASNTMAVSSFTSNPSGTGTLTAGNQTLDVGATLVVAANQAAGSYTGSFNVSVDYN